MEQRLNDHQSKKFANSYTAKSNDWVLIFSIGELDYNQARRIELHIKRMKSRKYIENLKLHGNISLALVNKYK